MTETDFFSKIEKHCDKNLPFVVYSRPINRVIKTWLQKDDTLHITTSFSESGFVFAPFDLDEDTILFPQSNCDHLEIEIDKLGDVQYKAEFSKKTTNSQNYIEFNSNLAKEKHISLVEKGIAAIKNSEFSKVVLSRFEETASNNNPISIFKRLFNTYENAMVYCWYHPKIGLWIGATPELLFKVEGKQLTTISLAGTKPYINNETPHWTDKEIEEQRIVTDYLAEQLQPFVNDSNISEVDNVRAGKLWHLKSYVFSRINQQTELKSIINALHPTPAVCGQPKEKAKAFILKNENYNREFYTGFLGELNLKQKKSRNTNRKNIENNAYSVVKTASNFYVNLRCAQLLNGKARIYVGGGIVKDSDAENEWIETANKSRTIKSILG